MVWERLTAPDRYFYPRPPRGERRCGLAKSALPRVISIHALREESDDEIYHALHDSVNISIHALREESDGFLLSFTAYTGQISIHALREESDYVHQKLSRRHRRFLSTPSARRATLQETAPIDIQQISIHALREESDRFFWSQRRCRSIFLSTPSARRATAHGHWAYVIC